MRLNAAIALGKIGQPAVDGVARILGSEDAGDRYYAVWTLGLIGPAARDRTPQVLAALADKNDDVRRKAAYALGRIGPTARPPSPRSFAFSRTATATCGNRPPTRWRNSAPPP